MTDTTPIALTLTFTPDNNIPPPRSTPTPAQSSLIDRPPQEYLTQVRQLLNEGLNKSELSDLCFDLHIEYDNLPGESKSDKARELVSYCVRRSRMPDLIACGKQLHPDLPWDNAQSTSTSHADPTGALHATIRWESDMIGVRTSTFTAPFNGQDLALVIQALDRVQSGAAAFLPQEVTRLTHLGIPMNQNWVGAHAPQQVGQALFQALTNDPTGAQALDTLKNMAISTDRPIALRLRFPQQAIDLAALPWELLWDAQSPTPLLFDHGQRADCTRHVDLAQALPPARPSRGAIQILAIAPQAGIDETIRSAERAARMNAWQPLIDTGAVIMREISPATRSDLVDAVQQTTPDIIHYFGHGMYSNGEGALFLDKDDGTWDRVPASRLAGLFGKTRLVVLHACQGAMVSHGTGAQGLLTGIAPALSAMGIPLVIGMQLTMRTQAATRASSIIYRALVEGQSVQDAVSLARQALYVEEDDQASWYVPVIYIRSRDTGPAYVLR